MDLKTLQIVCQVLLCCFSGTYSIPVEQFYGFGTDYHDTKCPTTNDFSIEVPISANFPFFGNDHSQVYVNENGGISTNARSTSFDKNIIRDGIRKILPYHSDVEIEFGGDIWYRQTTDPVLLQRATSEIRTAFPWYSSFTATWMFLTTWHNVNSFDEEPYKAGYFSGEDGNYLLFPESWRENEMITLSVKTNVGIPGLFMFEVGGSTIAPGPCPAIDIANASLEYSASSGIGEIMSITCNDGFILIGEERIVCDLDGSWGDSLPICEELECQLEEIDHGFVTGITRSSIKYKCDPGYTLVCGDEVMACGIVGLWDGLPPHCISISNGSLEYNHGEKNIDITCDEGFNLIGEDAVVCDRDGTWTNSLPVCEEIEVFCPLQEINHGFVNGENYNGGSITYSCEPGYTLVCGDEVMTCGLDKSWDGTIPQCISITNGSVEYSTDEGSGSIINITCDDGFKLIGEEAVVCDVDGTWLESLPVCEEITCPLQEINHGFVTGENNFGDSITFSCEPGYALVCGDEVMTCGSDGLWDGIIPYCIWRGKSNVAERDFKGNVDDNQGQFCSKLRENNGDFGQRPE